MGSFGSFALLFCCQNKFTNANELGRCCHCLLGLDVVTPPHTNILAPLTCTPLIHLGPFNLIACSPQAIAGEIGMDNVLDNVANSLFNGLLPVVWSKLAPATCKQLASWLEHLKVSCSRSSLIRGWHKNQSVPRLINLSLSHLDWPFRIAPFSTSIGRCRASRWSCGCLDCTYRRVTLQR